MMRLFFDCEGDGLYDKVTRVHCIAAKDPDTGERLSWKPHEIPQALETLEKADILIGHHAIGYDFRVFKKLYGFEVPVEKQKDSLVISRLIYANLRDTDGELVEKKVLTGDLHGSHSLKAWGMRLGVHKGDFEGPWEQWSPDMHAYMEQDVEVLEALWQHLKPEAYSQEAIELEHRIQRICIMMEETGWPFDVQAAGLLHAELVKKLKPIEEQLKADFGFWYRAKTRKMRQIVDPITGADAAVHEWFTPKVNNRKLGYEVGQPCTQLERVFFNPASRAHAVRCLMHMGWHPTEFTDSGQPKLDDAVLEKLSEQFPQGGALVEFLLIDKRIGSIATGDKAWLKQVRDDGRLHGTINPMGTQSSRASHSDPNLGQVPASKNPYGKECRSLFTVPVGYDLVGADQAGLQLRCLGHYLTPFDGGEYGKAVAEGDPHWRAVQAIGFTKEPYVPENGLHEVFREKGGKTLTYATVFGCHDRKAGAIIRDCLTTARNKNPEWAYVYERYFRGRRGDAEVGKPIRKRFYDALGLTPLLDKLQRFRSRRDNPFPGSLPGLDGRWVPCRSDHSALANLLQSAEAIICKRWVCDTYDALVAEGLKWGEDFFFVGWVHDELQIAVRKNLTERVSKIVVECAEAAGNPYKFRVALKSKAKVGRNWAETH